MSQEDPRILALREVRKKASQGGGAERIANQHARGKLAVHERMKNIIRVSRGSEIAQVQADVGQHV
jgi:acetyl-CoA carboxylase carboxyltransferase component